jgi:cyclopropane fatty-acyl-phospholipid synthase-like methyltransferase
MLRAALFHYGRWIGNGDRALREVAAALAATPDERVIDVGCGTGGFCRAVPGRYLGIDVDRDYVAFARRRWGSTRRHFELTPLADLDVGPGFDKAMLINCVHHLSDAEATAVLGRLREVVHRRLVVLDAAPEDANRLQAALLALDRGDFIRSCAAQRVLLERHFRITQEGRFPNTPHTLVQALFVCEPRP